MWRKSGRAESGLICSLATTLLAKVSRSNTWPLAFHRQLYEDLAIKWLQVKTEGNREEANIGVWLGDCAMLEEERLRWGGK